jgi:hypothetical protein
LHCVSSFSLKISLDFLQSFALGFRQEKGRGKKHTTVQPAKTKNIVEQPYWPTVGRNTAAMVQEIGMLMSSAILMPLERMIPTSTPDSNPPKPATMRSNRL